MKLEVAVIPVSDVERTKRFYSSPGWRLDADFSVGDAFQVVQFTSGLAGLDPLRQGSHAGRARFSRSLPGRVRHRGGARQAHRSRRRCG